jgi:hypothetical protein
MNCENTTFGCSLINILESKKPFTISDVMKFGVKDNQGFAQHNLVFKAVF